MSEFAAKLSALVSAEMREAWGDADRTGDVIERLIHSAGLTIAIAARGQPEAANTLLAGAESYLYEAAASQAKAGVLLGMVYSRSPRSPDA